MGLATLNYIQHCAKDGNTTQTIPKINTYNFSNYLIMVLISARLPGRIFKGKLSHNFNLESIDFIVLHENDVCEHEIHHTPYAFGDDPEVYTFSTHVQ